MKKLLAFTSIAILTAGVAQAKTGDADYGADMYEQHDRIEALFDELDLDNDGVVLNNEYTALQNLTMEKIPVEFSALGLDKNGVITRKEAKEFSSTPRAERTAYMSKTDKHHAMHDGHKMKTKKHYNAPKIHIDHIDTNGAYKLNN